MTFLNDQIVKTNTQEQRLITSLLVAICFHLLLAFLFRDTISFQSSSDIKVDKILYIKLSHLAEKLDITPLLDSAPESVAEPTTELEDKAIVEPIDKPAVEAVNTTQTIQETRILLDQKALREWLEKDTIELFDENSESFTNFKSSFTSSGVKASSRNAAGAYSDSQNISSYVRENGEAHIKTKLLGKNVCYKFNADSNASPETFEVVEVAFPYKCSSEKKSFKLSKR